MVILGAKGFAKEVLEVLHQNQYANQIYFFDDVTDNLPGSQFGFPILKSKDEVNRIFNGNFDFTLGLGNPVYRKKLYESFISLGGKVQSTISPFARIGHFDNHLAEGLNIMTGVVITNSVSIGKGTLINLNCTIGHDTVIEDFVEISPGSHISGNCYIGENAQLGTNCTILPKIKIGKNVRVGAGSVITKDVPDNVTIVGVPGKIVTSK